MTDGYRRDGYNRKLRVHATQHHVGSEKPVHSNVGYRRATHTTLSWLHQAPGYIDGIALPISRRFHAD